MDRRELSSMLVPDCPLALASTWQNLRLLLSFRECWRCTRGNVWAELCSLSVGREATVAAAKAAAASNTSNCTAAGVPEATKAVATAATEQS